MTGITRWIRAASNAGEIECEQCGDSRFGGAGFGNAGFGASQKATNRGQYHYKSLEPQEPHRWALLIGNRTAARALRVAKPADIPAGGPCATQNFCRNQPGKGLL